MDTDTLIERILNRMDEVGDALAKLTAETKNMTELQAKQNGNVARQQEKLNDRVLWEAKQEALTQSMSERLAKLESKSSLDNQTILKIAAIGSLTVLAVAKAGGPIVDSVMGLLK